jgi:hypothetical protein
MDRVDGAGHAALSSASSGSDGSSESSLGAAAFLLAVADVDERSVLLGGLVG